jgi:hypothetical protein
VLAGDDRSEIEKGVLFASLTIVGKRTALDTKPTELLKLPPKQEKQRCGNLCNGGYAYSLTIGEYAIGLRASSVGSPALEFEDRASEAVARWCLSPSHIDHS